MSDYVEIPPEYFNARGTGVDLALLQRPRALAAVRRRIFTLPPSSRLRQRLMGRLFGVLWVTYERGDFRTVPNALFSEDCELRSAMEGRVDLPELSVGREQVIRWVERWHEPFTDVRWRPLELFDGGTVLFLAVEMMATGRGSGIEIESPFYVASWIQDDLVNRQYTAVRRDEALRAAGFA